MGRLSQLFNELRRRNVVRVAAAYLVASWLILQISDVLLSNLGLPPWLFQAVLLLLMAGLPLALIFAWVYELTPDGIKLESEVDRQNSSTRTTGRKLDLVIIGVLSAAIALLIVERVINIPGEDAIPDLAELTHVNQVNADIHSRQAVAVIPFVDLTLSQDQKWIGEAIATEMQTALSKRSDLLILSRSTSFAFPDDVKSSQAIGRYLGVDILVEGTVRRMGNRVRVTAQLVSVADGIQLWSDVFEAVMVDNFTAEIAVADFFSQQVRNQLAAPFEPNVQFVDYSKSAGTDFSRLFISPASVNTKIQVNQTSSDDQSHEN